MNMEPKRITPLKRKFIFQISIFGFHVRLRECTNSWVVVSIMVYFHPYLEKIPILTNIFQVGQNHQPDSQTDCRNISDGLEIISSNSVKHILITWYSYITFDWKVIADGNIECWNISKIINSICSNLIRLIIFRRVWLFLHVPGRDSHLP